MPDLQLRELERRFKETGTVEDEIALLNARLRAGLITPARVEVAATLRNGAALALFGDDAPPEPATFSAWAAGFEPFGPEVNTRVAIAAARRAWGVAAPFYRDGDPGHPLRVVEAAEASVACPCLPHLKELVVRGKQAEEAARGPNAIQLGTGPAAAAKACLAPFLLFDDGQGTGQTRAQLVSWGPAHARLALCDEVGDAGGGDPSDSLLGEAGRLVREAVRDELVPWALGHDDPLRTRAQV